MHLLVDTSKLISFYNAIFPDPLTADPIFSFEEYNFVSQNLQKYKNKTQQFSQVWNSE